MDWIDELINEAPKVDLTVGTFKKTFIGVSTSAPQVYDYPNIAISLYGSDGERWVMLELERARYQIMRYCSGLNRVELDSMITSEMMQQELLGSIYNGF